MSVPAPATGVLLDGLEASPFVYFVHSFAPDGGAAADSDETVATVDTSGKITAIAPGEAMITVTCGQYSATCTVTCAGGSAASSDAGSTGGAGTASGDRSATSSDAGNTGDAGNADDTGSDAKTP